MKKLIKPITLFLMLFMLVSCSKRNINFKDQTINLNLFETYVIKFKNQSNLTYKVINSDVLSIDSETGEVFTYKMGKTDVLVFSGDQTITLTFNIFEPKILIKNNVFVKYHNDQEFYLNAAGVDSKEIEYSSLTPTIVLVNDEGRVTSLETGSGVIQVSLKGNKKVFINITIHVISKLELIVKEKSFSIISNFKHQLDYLSTDPFGLTIISSDQEILTVTNEGLITPLKAGSAVLTLISNYDNTLTEEVEIKVLDLANFIPVLEGEVANIALNSKVLGSSFKSLNNEVFKVDEFGFITAISKGQTNLEIKSLFSNEMITIPVHVLNENDYLLAVSINNMNQLTNYKLNISISQIIDQMMIYNSVYLFFDNNKIKFSSVNKDEYFVYRKGIQYHYYKDQGINRKDISEQDSTNAFIITELFDYQSFTYFEESKDYALINMESIKLFNDLFGEHEVIRLRVKINNKLIEKISFTLLVDDEFVYADITYSDIGLTVVEVPNYD